MEALLLPGKQTLVTLAGLRVICLTFSIHIIGVYLPCLGQKPRGDQADSSQKPLELWAWARVTKAKLCPQRENWGMEMCQGVRMLSVTTPGPKPSPRYCQLDSCLPSTMTQGQARRGKAAPISNYLSDSSLTM